MAGALVVCPTPIGNLDDVSPRIRETLKLGEQQWLLFDAAIRSSSRSGQPVKEALAHIMTTSENLLLVLDDVTNQYAALR